VIPAEFDYVRAESVEEAVRHLRENGEDAKLLAGGHSLLPLMKLRLAAPTLLIDIGRIPGLHGLSENGDVRIGALTTHAEVARAGLGIVSEAAAGIADPQVRHRGTLGGTLAHGDPASDLPAVVLALDGTIVAEGDNARREIPASEFFVDYLMTALEPHEVVTEVRIPDPRAWGGGHEKFNRRKEDWAMVAVTAFVKQDGGTVSDVRIGLTHMASTPLRATAAEDALRGQPLNDETISAAAALAAEGTSPPADLNASSDYKRHLAQVLCRRALHQAASTT
jgi:aerobic carbon-monoxide dehydrogenase medium subunit